MTKYAGPSEDKQVEISVSASSDMSGWGKEFQIRAAMLGLTPKHVWVTVTDVFTGHRIHAYLTVAEAESLANQLMSSVKWAKEHPTGP